MKKNFKIAATVAVVALVLSGCVTATVVLTNEAVKEEEEIESGNVFETSKATVTYYNNVVLSFKQNGKFIRVDEPNYDRARIIRPDSVFELDLKYKTYISTPNTNGKWYYSDQSYVFPVDWFELHTFLGDVWTSDNSEKGKMDVAGVECVSYTCDKYEYAGYNRIYMYKKIGSSLHRCAIKYEWKCEADFDIPADFHKVSGTVTYSKDFK